MSNKIEVADNEPITEDTIKLFLSISFSHHFEIIKIKDQTARWYYIQKTAQSFWSVRHLRTELKNKSHLQEQKLPNNDPLTK